MKTLKRLMLTTIVGLPLAACSNSAVQTANANDPNSNIIVTPSGKIVQAPPYNQRWGDKGGETGGSGRN